MFRAIVKPQRRKLQLTIPENYVGKEIEVFAFPVYSDPLKSKSKKKCFSAVSIKTKDFLFSRDEANER